MMVVFWLACNDGHKELSDQERYDTYCGLCHGYDGEGYLAPQANALANSTFIASASDDFLRVATIQGRPETKMSAWGESAGGPLTDDEVEQVIRYMRLWGDLDPSYTELWNSGLAAATDELSALDAEAQPDGDAIYLAQCQSCHGENGSGKFSDGSWSSALSLNNPTFLDSVSEEYLWIALELGRPGTAMGSYAEQLSPGERLALVETILGWRDSDAD